MKALKIIGIVTSLLALFCGFGIIGRVEMEERQFRAGEITQEEMTSDSDLLLQIGICGGVAVAGGVCWLAGAYLEGERI